MNLDCFTNDRFDVSGGDVADGVVTQAPCTPPLPVRDAEHFELVTCRVERVKWYCETCLITHNLTRAGIRYNYMRGNGCLRSRLF